MDRVNYSSQRHSIDEGHETSDWIGEAVDSKLGPVSDVDSSTDPIVRLRMRLEDQWPEWACRIAQAIDCVNARLSERVDAQLQQKAGAPQWESCLGQPSDDFVDDGYLSARWRLTGPSTWIGEVAKREVPDIAGRELRIALQHTFGQDSIFIEWGGTQWVRLALSNATSQTIGSAIAEVMEEVVSCELV